MTKSYDGLGFKLEPVTLTNLASGELEKQFQTCLAEALDIFAMADDYRTDKEGNVVTMIEMTSALVYKDGQASVVVSAFLKRPKRKTQARGIYLKDRQWLTTDDAMQDDLFKTKLEEMTDGNDH